MYRCDEYTKNENSKGDEDMSKLLTLENYKKLNLSSEKMKQISITPKVKDGKLLFDRNKKEHRYIVEND